MVRDREPLGLCALLVDPDGTPLLTTPLIVPIPGVGPKGKASGVQYKRQGGLYSFRLGHKLTAGPGWSRPSLKGLTRAQLKVGVLHEKRGLVGEFFLPLQTLAQYGPGAAFSLESRDFWAPRVTPLRPVPGAGGTVIIVNGHWQHGSVPSASVPDVEIEGRMPDPTLAESMTASLLARQNPNRAHELVEAVSRAKFPSSSETELDKVQQFFIDEFGTLRESWKHMVHLGKSVSPRARAKTLPLGVSAGSGVALDENEFKVALEKSGYSGNASQVWRQLGSASQDPRSTTSTARNLSVERAEPAARGMDAVRDTASARSGISRSAASVGSGGVRSRGASPSSGPARVSRGTWAGAEGDVEALLRASMASVFKSVGAGVRAIQKRQAMPTEVRVSDLFEALKKGNPRFGFPELKRLIPGSDRSETVSWVELGLEAEAARPAPQASVRASVAIEQLSDLLTDAARELRVGAQTLDGGRARVR